MAVLFLEPRKQLWAKPVSQLPVLDSVYVAMSKERSVSVFVRFGTTSGPWKLSTLLELCGTLDVESHLRVIPRLKRIRDGLVNLFDMVVITRSDNPIAFWKIHSGISSDE